MLKIHSDAKPLFHNEHKTQQIGWRIETRDFTFDAIQQDDETVNTYVEWGDDMGGGMANHDTWFDTKRHLDVLLQASQR